MYGWNGRHRGWFIDGIMYEGRGRRVRYVSLRCPVETSVSPVKTVKSVRGVALVRPVLSLGRSSLGLEEFVTDR